jgi:hypothetical protein
MNLFDLIQSSVEHGPDRPAINFYGRTISNAQLRIAARRVMRAASWIERRSKQSPDNSRFLN